jgi:hypothetical protein
MAAPKLTLGSVAAVREHVVKAAAAHVPALGFTLGAVELGVADLCGACDDASSTMLRNMQHAMGHLFARGAPAALVEHFVLASNAGARGVLMAKYDARQWLATCEAVSDVPPASVVAGDALAAKLACLVPVLHHWPAAVRIEVAPANAPFALKALAEFCDDVVYHCERMNSLRVYLEAEQTVLRFTQGGAATNATADSIRRLRKESIGEHFPLSRGPHLRDGLLGLDWYLKRGQVGAAYLAAVTSAIGECNGKPATQIPRSMGLARSIVASL